MLRLQSYLPKIKCRYLLRAPVYASLTLRQLQLPATNTHITPAPAAEQYLLSSGPVMASQRTTFIFFIEMILFFGAYYFGKYNNLYNNGRMAKWSCFANVNFDYYRILRIIGMPNFIVVFSLNHLNGGFWGLFVMRSKSFWPLINNLPLIVFSWT